MSQFECLVKVDKSLIEEAVQKVVSSAFYAGDFSTHPGPGYRAIMASVQKVIVELDFRPIIEKAVEERVNSVVDKVVGEILRRRVKRLAEEMEASGTLFAKKGDVC